MTQAMTQAITLDRAYAMCRATAKREAKNFYYAFVALPEPRRNAICAIYAFMRQSDDLADDESMSRDERQRQLDAWLTEWHAVCRCSGHVCHIRRSVSLLLPGRVGGGPGVHPHLRLLRCAR